MSTRRPLLFDSHALLKYFQREAGHEKVAKQLAGARASRVPLLLHVINLGEIIYITKRTFGDQKKIEVLAHIERLGFTVLPASDRSVYHAAEFKAEHGISFADCFALALAIEHGAVIVTGDPEFRKVEHLAEVAWIG